MNAALRKLADQLGLAKGKGECYGTVRGFPLSLTEASNLITVGVVVEFPTPEGMEQLVSVIHQNRKNLKLSEVKKGAHGVKIIIPSMGAQKRIPALLEWLWPELERLGGKGEQCPLCGMELSGGVWCKIDEEIFRAHTSCISKAEQVAAEEHREERVLPRRRIRGLIGAVLGAIVGSIPWIVAYYLGWIVYIFGLIIAVGSKKGYELLGGRPSWFKIVAVAVSTAFAVLFSVLVQATVYVVVEWQFTIGYAMGFVANLATTVDFWKAYAPDLIMGLFFAVLGCAGLLGEIRKEVKGAKGQIVYLEGKPADVADYVS